MKVYVVEHVDLEDDRYVRGVYADRDLAERAVSLPEVIHDSRSGSRVWHRRHDQHCCGSEEWEVEEALPLGPPEPETPVEPGLLIRPDIADWMVRYIMNPPYRLMTPPQPRPVVPPTVDKGGNVK